MTQAFENYNQLRVLQAAAHRRVPLVLPDGHAADSVRRDLDGLVSGQADHRPVQMLAAAAREIGAGHLDQRVEPQSNDEFGSLVEAFNAMASELAAPPAQGRTRRRIELERKHVEVEGAAPLHRDDSRAHRDRRRLGRRRRAPSRPSTAPRRGCSSLDPPDRRPARASAVFDRAELQPLRRSCWPARRPRPRRRRPRTKSRWRATGRSCTWPPWRRRSSATRGAPEGVVLVLDDVTPLIRAQKVAAWREVARRLAHEIKNPLTPIQLSAERLRRHFAGAPPQARGARRRVHDDDRRRGRIAEGAGRRVLAVRADAVAAHGADRSRAAHHRHARALQRHLHRRAHRPAVRAGRAARAPRSRADPAGDDQPGRQRDRGDGAARQHRRRDAARRGEQRRPRHRRRQRPGHPAGRAREAVPAVLLDQAARQRPRPRDRPPDHRRARRQHRRRRQHAAAARGLQSSCRVDRGCTKQAESVAIVEPRREAHDPDRRRRARRAHLAERRAARRGLQRRGGAERRGVPRARHARRRSI